MWDNERIFDYYEAEQERVDRLRKRTQKNYEEEEYEWQHYMNLQDNSRNYLK